MCKERERRKKYVILKYQRKKEENSIQFEFSSPKLAKKWNIIKFCLDFLPLYGFLKNKTEKSIPIRLNSLHQENQKREIFFIFEIQDNISLNWTFMLS